MLYTRPPGSVLAVAAIMLMILDAGCKPARFPVRGAVTFDGQPVEEGTISFEPADGQGGTTGGKIVAGKYEITGPAAPMPGKKIVRIFAARKTGRKVPAEMSISSEMVDEIERYIPEIHNTQSTLSCEIAARGVSQIDFHLKPP